MYVEGRLHTDRYEQGGDIRYFTKVIINNMQILDRKQEEEPVEESEEPSIE